MTLLKAMRKMQTSSDPPTCGRSRSASLTNKGCQEAQPLTSNMLDFSKCISYVNIGCNPTTTPNYFDGDYRCSASIPSTTVTVDKTCSDPISTLVRWNPVTKIDFNIQNGENISKTDVVHWLHLTDASFFTPYPPRLETSELGRGRVGCPACSGETYKVSGSRQSIQGLGTTTINIKTQRVQHTRDHRDIDNYKKHTHNKHKNMNILNEVAHLKQTVTIEGRMLVKYRHARCHSQQRHGVFSTINYHVNTD